MLARTPTSLWRTPGPANPVRTAQGPDPRHLGLLLALLPGPGRHGCQASEMKKMRPGRPRVHYELTLRGWSAEAAA